MKTSKLRRSCLSFGSAMGAIALIALGEGSAAQAQITRTWTGAGADSDMRTFQNYSPSGGINGNDVVFDSGNLSLVLDSGDASPNSVHITANANNLEIGTSQNRRLNIGDRVTVAAGVSAVFHIGLSVSPNLTEAKSWTIDVGNGGSLTVMGTMGSYSPGGSFYKTGTGTLYLGGSTSGMLTGFTSHYEEGVVTLRSGVTVGAPTQGDAGLMTVNLGTATKSATLKTDKVNNTRARIYGSLVTHGIARSRVEVDGELNITTLVANQGGTFAFALGGGGHITGTTLNLSDGVLLDLTGGAMGQTYHLFDFNTVTGFDASKFTVQHDQFSNFNVQMDNGVISVQVIPEPNVALLMGVALVGGGLIHFGRR